MKVTIFIVCLLTFLFAYSSQTFAVNFTVNQAGDAGDLTCDATCTLRDAVDDANNVATDDTISFAANVTYISLADSEIAINNAGTLSINGSGANVLTIDGGAGTNRIFFSNEATFNLSGVTLTGGNGTGDFNSGSGGAIFVIGGTTTISGVYFNANSADYGGGVCFYGGTNYRVENSTFSGNSSGYGGGILVSFTSLTVVNTTLTGNTAYIGGGILVDINYGDVNATVTLRGDTITANTADRGGGVFKGGFSTLDFGNTIIAGNTATTSDPEIWYNGGYLTSQGFNLVGDSAGDASSGNPITYKPTDILDTPPLLVPLGYYGGTTPTHRLQTGSPAIDKGFSFGLTTDQRGFTCPFDNPRITNATGGDGADIGAFEVQPDSNPQIGPPTNKEQCKNKGWMVFNFPRAFKNQGDCIQFVNTGN